MDPPRIVERALDSENTAFARHSGIRPRPGGSVNAIRNEVVVTSPSFTMGIEEEYLLVHGDTLDLVEVPQELMDDCAAELGKQVSPEFRRCQIEVGTGICASVSEAREDLKRLRSTIARIARRYGLAPLAVSCHPTASWKDQQHTEGERYTALQHDLAGVARRLLISGMHVHIGIENDDLRIDLMSQFSYCLPHLLALSASSPSWQGQDTGLASYRLTIFDNLPRTGLLHESATTPNSGARLTRSSPPGP